MLIAEVSEKYDISRDTLRYYERIGLLPEIARDKNGVRNYSESDCGWIEFIKCMRKSGLPVKILIQYVQLSRQGESTIDRRKSLLLEQKNLLEEKIRELNVSLEKLNYKIDNYDRIFRSSRCTNKL